MLPESKYRSHITYILYTIYSVVAWLGGETLYSFRFDRLMIVNEDMFCLILLYVFASVSPV